MSFSALIKVPVGSAAELQLSCYSASGSAPVVTLFGPGVNDQVALSWAEADWYAHPLRYTLPSAGEYKLHVARDADTVSCYLPVSTAQREIYAATSSCDDSIATALTVGTYFFQYDGAPTATITQPSGYRAIARLIAPSGTMTQLDTVLYDAYDPVTGFTHATNTLRPALGESGTWELVLGPRSGDGELYVKLGDLVSPDFPYFWLSKGRHFTPAVSWPDPCAD
jgi:hypothetical protein